MENYFAGVQDNAINDIVLQPDENNEVGWVLNPVMPGIIKTLGSCYIKTGKTRFTSNCVYG